MTLEICKERLTICRLDSIREVDLAQPFTFLSVTDEEVLLVCPEEYVPSRYLECEKEAFPHALQTRENAGHTVL